MLKITAAQLNFTIGDLSGNVAKMVTAASKAWTDQSDIVVFSEMSLTAYYPGDMLEEEGFMERVDAARCRNCCWPRARSRISTG
jgi:NAD+ synthase (glutamine-hydrolysing)